jgi:opacity protein-like surface antigen
MPLFVLLAAALVCSLLPTPAAAQEAPDFLFSQPRVGIGGRVGWLFARADSDVFDFVTEQLTIDRSDFDTPTFGADVDVALTRRASLVFAVDLSSASHRSEYRDFVDNERLPINQTTRLRELNLSAGFKMALTPRGREIGSRAWIPAVVTPYVGAGAGALHYEFEQEGDFVDFVDFSVFPDTFRSNGWAPSAHVFGGVDVRAWKRLYVTAEARYLWSKADLEDDFLGFEPIDLSGAAISGGIRYMF